MTDPECCPTCGSDDRDVFCIPKVGDCCLSDDHDAFHDTPRRHEYEVSPHSQYGTCHVCGRPETSPVHDTPASEREQTAKFVRSLGVGPGATIPPDLAEFVATAIIGQPDTPASEPTPSEDEMRQEVSHMVVDGKGWVRESWCRAQVAEAVRKEREACAKLCDNGVIDNAYSEDEYTQGCCGMSKSLAKDIRARGDDD